MGIKYDELQLQGIFRGGNVSLELCPNIQSQHKIR
jgi:hypothetical protein